MRTADAAVFTAAIVITLALGAQFFYQLGYDTGREACRTPVKMDWEKLSVRGQARWAKYLAGRTE